MMFTNDMLAKGLIIALVCLFAVPTLALSSTASGDVSDNIKYNWIYVLPAQTEVIK